MTTVRTASDGSGTAPSGRFGRHLFDRIEERDVDLMLLKEIATKTSFQRLVAAAALDSDPESDIQVNRTLSRKWTCVHDERRSSPSLPGGYRIGAHSVG